MTVHVTDVYEKERGCGFRRQGWYLRADGGSHECGKLPLKIEPCECCGLQVKLTRGLQLVNIKNLFKNATCKTYGTGCAFCLINRAETGYLLTIGHKFYKYWEDFSREADEMGISKRVSFPLPRNFKVGESVVLLAHPKVFTELVPEESIEEPVVEIDEDAPQKKLPMIVSPSETTGRLVAKDIPAVVMAFIPSRIEYVVSDTEPDAYLEQLVSQGVTLVRTHRVVESQIPMEVA